ncbi:MAG: FGGY-family carbohydrate kinase [Bacillus subtilis]|nr:FGGY-family carbohydrate kinase [Bacillus subtilis]
MRTAGIVCEQASVIGGGSKSDRWIQMLADALGITLAKTSTSEGGAWGAVLLAMTGCGDAKDVKSACLQTNKTTGRFIPDAKKSAYFEKRLIEYRCLYQSMHQR